MIIGHERNTQLFTKLIAENILPNTLLFSGQEGIGKKLFARKLAFVLNCDQKIDFASYNQCDCNSCSSLSNSPDLRVIDCQDREAVKVKNIRELLKDITYKSFSGKKRFVIFDNIEFIGTAAANVLLKTLEEPQRDLIYILITANSSRVLKTISSRCQIYFFNSLSPDEITKILGKEELAHLSFGSVSNAKMALDNYEVFQEITSYTDLLFNKDYQALMPLVKLLTKDKELLSLRLKLLILLVRGKLQNPDIKESLHISTLLHNLCIAEYYIFTRNINPEYLFNQIFINFLDGRLTFNNNDNNLIA